jgi:hypothetical protein
MHHISVEESEAVRLEVEDWLRYFQSVNVGNERVSCGKAEPLSILIYLRMAVENRMVPTFNCTTLPRFVLYECGQIHVRADQNP